MRSRLLRRRGALPATAASPDPGAAAPLEGLTSRTLVPRPDQTGGPATEMLFERLIPDDVAELERRLEGEHRTIWDAASAPERKRLALAFGLLYEISGVAEHTGLHSARPPHEVHSMAHDWLSEIGGSYYLADLVLESLTSAGGSLAPGSHALDFSCSSGRVVRPLVAAFPEVHWHGCDPNAGAIGWLAEHVPELEVFVSGTLPPLPFENESLQLAFAISVWSHFSAPGALRWLDEMHRLVAPGGQLILTAHGLNSCAWFSRFRDTAIEAKLGAAWLTDTVARLDQDGHCFWDVFGQQGDWGVVDSDWGLAFFTPEWLLEQVTPAWSVAEYRLGRALGNQDVYVLERR